MQPGPRVLQLANPHVTGPDVVEAQKLLAKNPYGSFDAGTADGEYGELTAGAVQRAKWELGYPANARDSTFGPQLKAFLSGKKPLPPPFKKRRAQRHEAGRLAAGDPQADRPVGALGLQEQRPDRLHAERQRQALAARQERVRAARDRLLRLRHALLLVGRRAEPERGGGLRRAPAGLHRLDARSHAEDPEEPRRSPATWWSGRRPAPGSTCAWWSPRGADPMLVSHGDDSGPKKLRFSAEDAYQRSHGHGTAVWLSAF